MIKPNDFWYTPPYVLRPVNEFFEEVFFDPCPIDPDFNGLISQWGYDCFINPPYSRDLRREFINRGTEQFVEKNSRYLWLVNYANSRDLKELRRRSSAVCIPHERIKFIPGRSDLGDGKSPRYDNIFILWGNSAGFADAFRDIGDVYLK